MHHVVLQPGRDTQLGCGGSPFLDGHHGLGRDPVWDCDGGRSTHDRASTQQRAMSDIMEAGQTHNPERRAQLLRQALALLNRDGNSDPASDPTACNTPAPENTCMPAPMPTSTSDPTHCDPTEPPAGGNTPSASGGLTVSGDSVNTGEYTITASTKNDGSLTITNNVTHQSTEVWGDPHIKVNGQNIAQFQKDNLNIQLQDGTVIHIQPTATNSKGVSHIAQVSITRGNEAVTMGGTGAKGFANGVTLSGVMNDGRYQSALYNTPTATDITLGADGDLYYNNANGSMGREITPNAQGGQTDLDGAGGGLVGDPRGAASAHGTYQLEQRLMALLEGQQQSFYSMMMMQELSHMMSQPGSQST